MAPDTLCNVYSTTKALGGLCAVILADRNFIDRRKSNKILAGVGKLGKKI